METRPLGASGIEATVIALGTWPAGGWMWGGTDTEEALRAMQVAIDEGITLIDSAPVYGLGQAEELVGRAIQGRPREDVVIATKCGLVWHVEKGEYKMDERGEKIHLYLGPESIRHEVKESLSRLQVETIDLYQTHWQDETTPIAKTMETLMALKAEGKIRAIGASNVELRHIEEYCKAGQLDAVQQKYSMLDRDQEKEILPYCREHNIAFLAYSPLALGLLTGKIGPEREFAGDDTRNNRERFSTENRKKVLRLLDEIKPIADRYGATIAQTVIAWTAAQPGVTHVLCGSRKAQKKKKNAKAGDMLLAEDEVQAINDLLSEHASDIL